MLRQIAVGIGFSLVNIAVHALVTLLVIRVARGAAAYWQSVPAMRLAVVMIAAVAVLMTAHTCEVAIWAIAYEIVGATSENSDQLYFAFVNFTTLGYGDILPVQRWRLLGPMTAMNGVLLFGWSTAVIFEILNQALRRDRGHTGQDLS